MKIYNFDLLGVAAVWPHLLRPGEPVQVAIVDPVFGPEAATPADYIDHDWIADPWSEGCYVGLPAPGALTELGRALRTPHGRVHWAGTETATAWIGYIEGALPSGEAAAQEVALALQADR